MHIHVNFQHIRINVCFNGPGGNGMTNGGSDLDKKRSVVNGVKELDPVTESPGENQEE